MGCTDHPIVFGAPYSVYVRAVRLALEEKGVAYELVPVDIFAVDGPPSEHLTRHPFGKIPAFEHTGFCLYEAGAITRYIDEAFCRPATATCRSPQPGEDEPDHQHPRQLRLSNARLGHLCRARFPPGDRLGPRRSEGSSRIAESSGLPVCVDGVDGRGTLARRANNQLGRSPRRADVRALSARSRGSASSRWSGSSRQVVGPR
jgi:Glutathione S-transferase, N-terminal domain